MLEGREPELFDIVFTLLSVKDRQCHWPVAEQDGELYVCGKESLIGHPYCSCHCHMAYTNFGVKK
jgi:hypothetical protein